jgi:glycerol-3-phosphate cytidylyltransferase
MFEIITKLRKSENKKIGFTASTFDLFTPGHVYMLEVAKSKCDFLIVGLLSDPTISRPDTKNKPIQSIFERYVHLQSIGVVDMIIPFDTEEDLDIMIKMINPDIRIVGEEYKGAKHTGFDSCKIFYNKRNNPYSSSQLRERIYLIEKSIKNGPEKDK